MWSLGIILVNLTCGRNPWKRASIEDSTFRAYLKNPKFLSSILPLSPELDAILRRIFECDPRRRIGILELRDLVVRCPRFTTHTGLSTPPTEEPCHRETPFKTRQVYAKHFVHQPAAPCTPPPSPPISPTVAPDGCPTAILGESFRSCRELPSSVSSTCADLSCGENQLDPQSTKHTYVPRQPLNNFYGSFFSLDSVTKPLVPQAFHHSVQVC